jgi:hypothetical protein
MGEINWGRKDRRGKEPQIFLQDRTWMGSLIGGNCLPGCNRPLQAEARTGDLDDSLACKRPILLSRKNSRSNSDQ